MSIKKQIQWFGPMMTGNELTQLSRVIDSNFVNEGPATTEFEQAVSQITGARYVCATNSATVGLFLVLKALDIGYGDEVIVPNFSYVATANAVSLSGATPVFCDINLSDFLINLQSLDSVITDKTKAVLSVDVNGRTSYSTELQNYCQRKNLKLIFDSAESLGSVLNGELFGMLGDACVFSLSPNKIITTGQGGLICTQDESLNAAIRRLKNQGLSKRGTGGNDDHEYIGFNFKFTDIQASVGLAQVEDLPNRIAKFKYRNERYYDTLSGNTNFELASYCETKGVLLWPDILVENNEELARYLATKNIGCRPFWKPISHHPPYSSARNDTTNLENSLVVSRRGLWLPAGFNISEEEIQHVCKAIISYFA